MNMPSHLLLNAIRCIAFNFENTLLVKFHSDAISNAGAVSQNYMIQTRFTHVPYAPFGSLRKDIFAKLSRPGRRKRLECTIFARECASGCISLPPHMARRVCQKV